MPHVTLKPIIFLPECIELYSDVSSELLVGTPEGCFKNLAKEIQKVVYSKLYELKGLTTEAGKRLNGLKGLIIGSVISNGTCAERHKVLLESGVEVAIKAENLVRLDQESVGSSLSGQAVNHAGGIFGKPAEAGGGQNDGVEQITEKVSGFSLGI